jgi:polyferredoxin
MTPNDGAMHLRMPFLLIWQGTQMQLYNIGPWFMGTNMTRHTFLASWPTLVDPFFLATSLPETFGILTYASTT